MYGIVLYQQSTKKCCVCTGACTLAALGSMQPEHKTQKMANTVLKSIITEFRYHICSCQLRDRSRTVH